MNLMIIPRVITQCPEGIGSTEFYGGKKISLFQLMQRRPVLALYTCALNPTFDTKKAVKIFFLLIYNRMKSHKLPSFGNGRCLILFSLDNQ